MTPWLLAAILLVILAVAAQVLIPWIGGRRIERRLAENGGEAFVIVEAFPATRLLRRRGRTILVRGNQLAIGMSKEGGGLASLDGFERVDIALGDFVTGPFQVAEFILVRNGAGPYVMRSEALTTGAALADFGGEALGGMAPLLGLVARQAPLGGRPFPVSVEVELLSSEGLLTVGSGGGTIAGYPAGPIASTLAAAVARRLEITY